ncbi:ion channel TACAN-like [Ostrea edulis]|uniref:ion channel TACAN-like n=1 Tax=Ostrea edulis TaxID=37623 RepID=UPI00209526BC|nr:ion channel TACAN-like [Ostrea edulis]
MDEGLLGEEANLKSCMEDWNELNKEFTQLEATHDHYKKTLENLWDAQKKCLSGIAHQRYRTKQISDKMNRLKDTSKPETHEALKQVRLEMLHRKSQFREMEEFLPHKNGIYLSIILGSVSVSLLNKEDKYAYKHNYETFKATVSYFSMALSLILLFVSEYRWLDAVLHFLLVWYYCTLTIRENILMVNGSRIKGWWVTHHFISTVCAALTLIWPDSYTYKSFRGQYSLFSCYLSFLYIVQFFYQKGALYRLRSLGQRHEMDITVEGFMSWMWKGISFLLPLLFAGYFFQLYNAYVLYRLSQDSQCKEWQVLFLAIIHLILSVGNITTTLKVVFDKLKPDISYRRQQLRNKYRFNSNLKKDM